MTMERKIRLYSSVPTGETFSTKPWLLSYFITAVALSLSGIYRVTMSATLSSNQWATIGQNAVVTCSPGVSDPITIQWRKSNISETVPPTGAASSILDHESSTNMIVYGPGIDHNHYDALQSSDGRTFSLIVKSVTLDDNIKYWCNYILSSDTVQVNSTIILIRVPPSMIRITNNGTSYNTGESIPLVAGDGHQFTCATSGINPAATFTWNLAIGSSTSQPQGIQMDSVNSMDARLLDSSNLIAVDIPESPATGQLMCGATNRQDGITDTERDITVSLQIKVPPKTSSMSISGFSGSEQGSVDQAKQHMIQCLVQGTRPAATIEWYLDSVKQSGTSSDSHPPGQNELIDTTSTWTFTPIRADHNKEVRCEASTPESERPLTSVQMVPLKVNGPPDTPVIMGGTSPMTEGVQIVLTCTADEGYPDDWSLDWSSNGIPISSSIMHSPTSENRYRFSSMVNFTLRRQDNGNNITCTANKASWTTGPVGYLGPIDVQFCAGNISVKCPGDVRAGNLASMECLTSESSNPTTTLTWSNGSVSVTGPSDQENTLGEYAGQTSKVTYTTGVLTKYNNKNEFKCCAVNSELSCGRDVCHMCTLNVEYAPEFTSLTHSPNNPVTEGSNVTLTCTVDANPMPGDVTWEKQGSNRAFNSKYNAGTSTLTLSSITREQAGYYTCTANNGVPTDNPGDDVVSSQLTVIVHYEVNITNKEMTEQGGKDGGSASLICIAEGNPRPTMQWYGLNSTVITNETDTAKFMVVNVITGGDGVYGFQVTSTLTINNIDSDMDFGTYTCISTNGIGEEDMLKVNLTGTRRPDKPIRVMIIGQTAESLTVTWTAGYDGGEEQSFRVSYLKTLDSTETGVGESVTGGKTTYTVTGLEDYTEYEIRVYARNAIGENTDYAKVVGHTLPKPPSSDAGIGITVEYNTDQGNVKVTGLRIENGCIQLEVKYEGNDTWQECGKCIDSDQTVTLSEWCAASQKRRRRAVGDIEDVRAKLCIGGLCSEAAPAEQVKNPPQVTPPDNRGIIVGAVVGGVVLLAIIIALATYLVRMSPADQKSRRKKTTDSFSNGSDIELQSPSNVAGPEEGNGIANEGVQNHVVYAQVNRANKPTAPLITRPARNIATGAYEEMKVAASKTCSENATNKDEIPKRKAELAGATETTETTDGSMADGKPRTTSIKRYTVESGDTYAQVNKNLPPKPKGINPPQNLPDVTYASANKDQKPSLSPLPEDYGAKKKPKKYVPPSARAAEESAYEEVRINDNDKGKNPSAEGDGNTYDGVGAQQDTGGRTANDDGLIYVEVGHARVHPPDQPPIQTEPSTEYASLDFSRMSKKED